jgi:hypothetical protein
MITYYKLKINFYSPEKYEPIKKRKNFNENNFKYHLILNEKQ